MLPGQTYHIFNRANGNEKLFTEERNYYFFLNKLTHHILPVADIHGYCLMPNHFHLLAEIKPFEAVSSTFKTNDVGILENKISKCFANLFSSYTQAFNKVNQRMGNLFMSSFKQKLIEDTVDYFAVIHYIHTNPVHHGYIKNIGDWKFSSYKAMAGNNKTLLAREKVHNIFDNQIVFLDYHKRTIDLKLKFLDC